MILKGQKSQIDVKITADVESDNGKTIRVPFVCTFKKPKVDEARDTLTALQSGDLKDEDFISDYLIGWKGLDDDNGDAVEFNVDNLAEVINVREYRAAIVQGLMSVIAGREAIAKN